MKNVVKYHQTHNLLLMMQRSMIVKDPVSNFTCLIVDDPTSNLDVTIQAQILNRLRVVQLHY